MEVETPEMADQFDLVVIGGGPGGYGAALYATSAGLNVAVVEKDAVGGTCLNRGCIPAKAYLESAAVQRHVAHAADFGIEASAPSVNFGTVQARKQKIVDGIVKSLAGFMKSKKITILSGVGSLGPNRTVTVQHPDGSSSTVQGTNVLLAAGSVPRVIPGFEPGGAVMTSDEVLMLQSLPARVAVIGGGAIGCEFASTFADLGSQVTILEGLPKILPGLDADVANVVVRSFKKKNIDIRTGVKVTGHTPNPDAGTTTVHFGADGEEPQHLECRRGLCLKSTSASSALHCRPAESGAPGLHEPRRLAVIVPGRHQSVLDSLQTFPEYCSPQHRLE